METYDDSFMDALDTAMGAEPAPLPKADEPVDEKEETSDDVDAEESASDQAPEDGVGEEKSEEGEDGEPEEPAIDPPAMWTDEGKEAFKTASPELQKYIIENEKLQNGAVTRAQQEAAEYRKQNASIGQFAEQVSQSLSKAQLAFKADWDGVTEAEWDNLAIENPDEFKRLRQAQRDQSAVIAQLEQAEQEARSYHKAQWVEAEANSLVQDLPELRNPENMNKLIQFAVNEGLTMDELGELSAKGFKIIHKLMRATQSQAAPAPAEEKKEEKKVIKPSLRPSGVTQQRARTADDKFKADPSWQNLVNIL